MKRIFFTFLLLIAAFPAILLADVCEITEDYCDSGETMGHMSEEGGRLMMGNFGFGLILQIIFWTLIIIAFIAITKGLVNKKEDDVPVPEKSSMNILKNRYARGEISKKEFEEKMKDLT